MSDNASGALALLARLEAESGRPLRAMLELSDRCNEVCVHCYQVQGQKGELTTADWRGVLDELAEAGVLMLTLSGGEVTLRPDFLELVAYARSLGFALRVFTNGLTMTEALARELARHSVLDVEISVYGTRAEIHDFVTGVPGSFERTVRGVSALVRAGVCVTIKSVALSVNHDDLAHYAAFAAGLGAQHRIDTGGVMAREDGDRCTEALQPPDAALTVLEKTHGAMHEVSAASSGRMPSDELLCGAAHELHFEANGEVRPCTMLDVRLGHAGGAAGSAKGVLAAYGSEAARGVRSLRWGHVHGCRECDLARYCTRCHASALSETGDALGPYPSACARARRVYAAQHSDIRIIANASRGETLGPYRRLGPGLYEAFEDSLTAEDLARAEQLGWIHNPEGGRPAPELAVRPGELVQIRRPGRRSSRVERVPGGQHHASNDFGRPLAPSSQNSSSAEERPARGDDARELEASHDLA